MEKHQKKLILEAFKLIDWNAVLIVYNGCGHKIKGHRDSAGFTRDYVKKELMSLCEHMLVQNIEELELDYWIIRWTTLFVSSDRKWNKIEILFIPNRACAREDEIFIDDVPEGDTEICELDEQERKALESLLKKSEKEENYELCAAIHTRLKKLNRIIRKKDEKHKELSRT